MSGMNTHNSVAAGPATSAQDNPFFRDWTASFGVPPFGEIAPEHFRPAFTRALAEHEAEVEAVARSEASPSFENTVEALERSGEPLSRLLKVFYSLSGAHTNEALLEIEREMSPVLAAHWNRLYTNEALFRRLDFLLQQGDGLHLTPEQARVLERYHVAFR